MVKRSRFTPIATALESGPLLYRGCFAALREAVWCDGEGLAIFDKLHSRACDDQVILYAFDLLELDGEDWRPRPLEERKAKLAKLLAKAPAGVQYSEHLEGDVRAEQGMAQDQEPGSSWHAPIPGRTMTAPNHLVTALDFAARAWRARDEGERARLLALAAKHREMAVAEAVAFAMETPKRPAASVKRAVKRKRLDEAANRGDLGKCLGR
jgi:hypothetical protein